MSKPAIISIIGKSGSGKTTLIERLVPAIKQKGYRIGVIKHSSHHIVLDHPQKDSWRFQQSGADCVAACSSKHFVLFQPISTDMSLSEIASHYFFDCDILLTEGFKKENSPKIVIIPSLSDISILDAVTHTIAIISNEPFTDAYPHFLPNDIKAIVQFIEGHIL